LVSPDPDSGLWSLRGLPRFGSHLGPDIQEHVERMKTLGYRYDEKRFRSFDEFLQRRPGACHESFSVLVGEYAKLAVSPAMYMERVKWDAPLPDLPNAPIRQPHQLNGI
jgi:integrase/recombinase XerD